jgi:hypothetical protein
VNAEESIVPVPDMGAPSLEAVAVGVETEGVVWRGPPRPGCAGSGWAGLGCAGSISAALAASDVKQATESTRVEAGTVKIELMAFMWRAPVQGYWYLSTLGCKGARRLWCGQKNNNPAPNLGRD